MGDTERYTAQANRALRTHPDGRRSATAAEFASANPILSRGELGEVLDTGELRVGDGTTAWASLPVSNSGTYARLLTTDAASTAASGTLAAWHLTPVDATSASATWTLPAASSVTAGVEVAVKKADTTANTVTVSRAGSDLIFGTGSGSATKTLTLAGEAITFVSDGVSKWTIQTSDTPSGVLASTYVPRASSGAASSVAATGTAGADQTATLQGEITALATFGGGTLYLPAGVIPLDSTLTLPSTVTIQGAGRIYRNSTAGRNATTLYIRHVGTAVKATSATNVGIRRLAIKAASASGSSMIGIYLNGAWYSRIDEVAVINYPEANGYAFKLDVNTTFGAYKNHITDLDAYGGVIGLVGNGSGTLVTTTVIDTCWAARYEATDTMCTWLNCTPEAWTATYTGDAKGGFTFDGYGHHVLMHANMEHASGDFCALLVLPTFTGKGVEEFGTGWQGFAGTYRVVGAQSDPTLGGGQILNNNTRKSQNYPLNTATDYVVDQWGQMEPNGTQKLWARYGRADNVSGGTQTAYPVMKRMFAGTEVEFDDGSQRYFLKNTKTLAADGSTTTYFTIPASATGTGFSVKVVAWGIHNGNGQVGSYREYVVAKGPLVAALAAQVNAGVNTLTIAATASGSNLLVTGSLAAVGSASDITLSIEIIGGLVSGVTKS